MSDVALAFIMTTFAGLSTGIGAAMAFFTKRENKKFLSASLGFSAGVMIYVSFVEIWPESIGRFSVNFNEFNAELYTVLSFFAGMLLILIIDRLIPSYENPHEIRKIDEIEHYDAKNKKLRRMGLLAALVISIHNFPEGMATFASVLNDPKLGIAIAIAIALHNIPEGIAVSVPLYHSTGKRKKSFWLALLSGMSEPLGALVGYLILMPYLNDTIFGVLFGAVAGIMVFISLDELLPAAKEYDTGHLAIYGLFSGMLIMAGSLILFKM